MHTKNQVILFVFHRPDNTLNASYPFVYSFRSIVKRYIPNTTKWISCIPPTRSEGFAGSLQEQAGLSQRDLAEISGVPVRTIQQYEQQQKDIRKAAYETVCRLADALHCAPDDCMPPNVQNTHGNTLRLHACQETLNNPLWLIFQHSIRSSTEQCRAAARSFSVCACARFKSFRRCS